tara:strand:+ start:1197 stop:1652 length:456 start_codon:yes stop_codon:yes gene_type:complete
MAGPNTLFSAGNIYTAEQANNFPRGLMATPATSTTTDSTITAEEIQLTYTFSQVNGRSYLLQYFEPAISGSASGTMTARITTGVAGTPYNSSTSPIATLIGNTASVVVVYTAGSSGSVTIYATLQASSGTATATRSATRFPQLYAVDLGTL